MYHSSIGYIAYPDSYITFQNVIQIMMPDVRIDTAQCNETGPRAVLPQRACCELLS